MEDNIIYIVGALIFLAVRYFISQSKSKSKSTTNTAKTTVQKRAQEPKAKQSIDDIFSDFVKELEKKQSTPPVQKQMVQPKQTIQQVRKPLDWQKVSTTQMKAKQRILEHDAYSNLSHKIDPSHKSSEPAKVTTEIGIDYDASEVDWAQAFISKEVLDRKY